MVTHSPSSRERAERHQGGVLGRGAKRGKVTETGREPVRRGDGDVKGVGRGWVGSEPYSPLGFASRDTGDRRGGTNSDRAGGRSLAQDYRVQWAGQGTGRGSTRHGFRFLLAADRRGMACDDARGAEEQEVDEVYDLGYREGGGKHLGQVSNQWQYHAEGA